jgi:hypothetical protein
LLSGVLAKRMKPGVSHLIKKCRAPCTYVYQYFSLKQLCNECVGAMAPHQRAEHRGSLLTPSVGWQRRGTALSHTSCHPDPSRPPWRWQRWHAMWQQHRGALRRPPRARRPTLAAAMLAAAAGGGGERLPRRVAPLQDLHPGRRLHRGPALLEAHPQSPARVRRHLLSLQHHPLPPNSAPPLVSSRARALSLSLTNTRVRAQAATYIGTPQAVRAQLPAESRSRKQPLTTSISPFLGESISAPSRTTERCSTRNHAASVSGDSAAWASPCCSPAAPPPTPPPFEPWRRCACSASPPGPP